MLPVARKLSRLSDGVLTVFCITALLVCVFYAYAAVVLAPYPGVVLDPNWVVNEIPACEAPTTWCDANQGKLKVGDQIQQIGDLTFPLSRQDRRLSAFGGYAVGESVRIVLQRGGQELAVDWQILGPTNDARLQRLSGLLIGLPFWIAGTMILVSLRPRDGRWRALILFNFITAVWVAAGLVSPLHTAYSSLVMHALSWFMVPVYWHLHLILPGLSVRRSARFAILALTVSAVASAVLEIWQLLPERLYDLGLGLAVFGSLCILAFQLSHARTARDLVRTRLLFVGIGTSLMPGIILGVIPTILQLPAYDSLRSTIAALAVPFLPYFYIYAIYKNQLGNLESWLKRLLSLYAFVLIYATAFISIHLFCDEVLSWPTASLAFNLALSTLIVVAILSLRTRFERLVDQIAYGVRQTREDILPHFADRIPAALDADALFQLLEGELTSSLLIRESVLYLLKDNRIELGYSHGRVPPPIDESADAIKALIAQSGIYRPEGNAGTKDTQWVRLAITLGTRSEVRGIWLLGRRDPDDFYPSADIALLKILGNQIAIGLENIRLFKDTKSAVTQLEQSRQRLDEALSAAVLEKSRYAAVIQSMGAAAVITDQDHCIVAVNSLAEMLLGQKQSSLMDQLWHDLFSSGNRNTEATSETGASFWHLAAGVTSRERHVQVRGRFPLRSNAAVVLDVVSTPIHGKGTLEGYVHILHDASALEEFAQAKDRFLLNIAHELAGPLASWRASLDTLIEDYATVSTRDLGVMLRTLQRATIKFENLVATLVDIGRIQAGRFVVRPTMTQVNRLILDSVSSMEPLLRARGQPLELMIDGVSHCAVLADRQRIGQVIGNYLKNASKYAPEDRPVRLSAYADAGFVFVEVTDHGQGIAADEQEQLFSRFYRAKRPEHEGAGIGIGLALVKGIVEAHGGQVGVRSRLGEGATFWFSLPEVTPPAAGALQTFTNFITEKNHENTPSG